MLNLKTQEKKIVLLWDFEDIIMFGEESKIMLKKVVFFMFGFNIKKLNLIKISKKFIYFKERKIMFKKMV